MSFQPKKGGHGSTAITDAAGRYRLNYLRNSKGALLGSHRVIICTASEADPQERVPSEYNKKTTLVVEVVAGE
ncbi:MAG: hypothetical protein ACWGMZ_07510, partial [Thermoguttaceae bacterium]